MLSKCKFTCRKESILFILLLGSFLVAAGRAQETGSVLEKTFSVKEGGTLTSRSDVGSIEVRTSSREVVEAKVMRRTGTWNKREAEELLEDFEVNFSQSGNDVTIEARYRRGMDWERNHNNLQIQFMITVPAKYNLHLGTAGGSIWVGDLEGQVIAETAGGSLKFGHIKGPVRGRTSGGSITLDGCAGEADVRTSGGSIKIGAVDGNVNAHTSGGSISIDRARGKVIAETAGGSISVSEVMGDIDARTSGGSVSAHLTRQPEGDCRLETSAGSVTVYLAKDIAVDVEAKASWGKVDSDFPLEVQGDMDESYVRGKINGGGPKLYLKTSSGKIRIRQL